MPFKRNVSVPLPGKITPPYTTAIIVVVAAVLSISAALLNGFPLSYIDLGTYIDSGFEGYAPPDRPVFYGLFLRHISLSRHLFLVVFAQALLACWLMRDLIRAFVKPEHVNAVFLIAVVLIVLTTSYSVVVSLLIPDIFTPLCYLAVVNILWGTLQNKASLRAYYCAFVFFVITQNASILSFLILLPSLLLFFYFKKEPERIRKCLHLIAALFIGIVCIAGHNYLSTGKARLSAMSHVFIMSRMIEFGVVQDYLDKTCESKQYRICPYKDSLQWDFIFNKNSVLYKTGGWEKNKEEYTAILKDLLLSKEYGPLVLQKTTRDAVKQLYTFDTYVDPPLLKGSPPYGQIKWRFDNELKRYEHSRQNRRTFYLDRLNSAQRFVVTISVCVLLLAFIFQRKRMGAALGNVVGTLAVFMIVNALIVSFFATVDARYQMRLIWLFPVLALIIIYSFLTKDKNLSY